MSARDEPKEPATSRSGKPTRGPTLPDNWLLREDGHSPGMAPAPAHGSWSVGGPASIRRSTRVRRLISSSIGRRSSHQVAPASVSGPSTSRASAALAELAPPRTTRTAGLNRRRGDARCRRPARAPRPRVGHDRDRRTRTAARRRPTGRRAALAAIRPVPTDPDGHAGALQRRRQQGHVIDVEMRPVVRHRPAGPVAVEQLEALVQALGEQPSLGRLAEAPVLVVDRAAESAPKMTRPRLIMSRVDTCRASCCGPATRDRCHQRAELDPRRGQRRRCEQHRGVAERASQPLVRGQRDPRRTARPTRPLPQLTRLSRRSLGRRNRRSWGC